MHSSPLSYDPPLRNVSPLTLRSPHSPRNSHHRAIPSALSSSRRTLTFRSITQDELQHKTHSQRTSPVTSPSSTLTASASSSALASAAVSPPLSPFDSVDGITAKFVPRIPRLCRSASDVAHSHASFHSAVPLIDPTSFLSAPLVLSPYQHDAASPSPCPSPLFIESEAPSSFQTSSDGYKSKLPVCGTSTSGVNLLSPHVLAHLLRGRMIPDVAAESSSSSLPPLHPAIPMRMTRSSSTATNDLDLSALRFDDLYDDLTIADCRFPFEYEGGHIVSAVNVTQLSQLEQILNIQTSNDEAARNTGVMPMALSSPTSTSQHSSPSVSPCPSPSSSSLCASASFSPSSSPSPSPTPSVHRTLERLSPTTAQRDDTAPLKSHSRHLLILHCEFSQSRAPFYFSLLRARDRARHNYPDLSFPEMYVLAGGFKQWHALYPQYCISSAGSIGSYICMNDKRWTHECSNGLKQRKAERREYADRKRQRHERTDLQATLQPPFQRQPRSFSADLSSGTYNAVRSFSCPMSNVD